MATYTPNRPVDTVRCGSGNMEMEAPNEVVAIITANIGQFVGEAVERAAIRAMEESQALLREVAQIEQPRTLYTLGAPKQTGANKWVIPFEVFIGRGPRPH
jgi:hypothetical protein